LVHPIAIFYRTARYTELDKRETAFAGDDDLCCSPWHSDFAEAKSKYRRCSGSDRWDAGIHVQIAKENGILFRDLNVYVRKLQAHPNLAPIKTEFAQFRKPVIFDISGEHLIYLLPLPTPLGYSRLKAIPHRTGRLCKVICAVYRLICAF